MNLHGNIAHLVGIAMDVVKVRVPMFSNSVAMHATLIYVTKYVYFLNAGLLLSP